ncbi:MAG: acyltransferase family protein [Xanthobacteraceae bacterium]
MIAWIQGLRAFAVLVVIIYHLSHSLMPGGFIGVDLFFVISGFLITRKLLREIVETGRLNVISFWGGRAKRLLPNALLTLVAVLVASMLLLPAYRHGPVSLEVTRAALFVSNFLFANQAVDYFRFNDVPSPVLHYWSLSIEEQFYFGLPLLLIAVCHCISRPNNKAFIGLISAICATSFIYCLYESWLNPTSAFFDTRSRIWQLALGGLTGALFERSRSLPSPLRVCFAYSGIIALLVSILLYNDQMGYPGTWAIVPTTASALILIGLPASRRLTYALSRKPITAIGDRSYSLYLWHWPVIAIAAEYWPDNPLTLLLSTFIFIVLACASYQLIEYPIHKSERFARFRLGLAAVGLIFVVGGGTLLHSYPITPASKARNEAILAASSDFSRIYRDHCHLAFEETRSLDCVYANKNSQHTVVLFGDSHAAQWFDAIEKAATDTGWRLVSRTKSSCPSVDVGMWLSPLTKFYEECDIWRNNVLAELKAAPPDLVIIANSSHYHGLLYDRSSRTIIDSGSESKRWSRGTLSTIEAIISQGSRVVLIQDNPRLLASYKNCLSVSDHCGRIKTEALAGMKVEFRDISQQGVTQIDFNSTICDGSWCSSTRDGNIIYQDSHHLTASYASTYWHNFREILIHNTPPNTAESNQ